MNFESLSLAGAFRITMQPLVDERGFFERTFCAHEFRKHGVPEHFVQCNVSHNTQRGTVRGLHFQHAPCQEGKLVRCTRGAIFDVLVDLRPASVTFLKWHGEELSAHNHRSLYIPPGFAHGFQTLLPDSDVFYQMTTSYEPGASGGIRYSDPTIGILWPHRAEIIISNRDRNLPWFDEASFSLSNPGH